MAQIAEDLLLLLLDNARARPALDPDRREKVLSAAVLLDLAFACRIRPAVDGEGVRADRLLLLAGPAFGIHKKPFLSGVALNGIWLGPVMSYSTYTMFRASLLNGRTVCL